MDGILWAETRGVEGGNAVLGSPNDVLAKWGNVGPLQSEGGDSMLLPPAMPLHPTPGGNSQLPPGPSAQRVSVGLPSS